MFAVFPTILALLVVASFVLGSEEAQASVMALVARYAPMASDVVAVNIEQLLGMSGTVGLIALVGLIWSASGVASALFQAVNRAWGVQGSRLLLSGRLYSLAMILIVGALLLLALSIHPIVSLVQTAQAAVLGSQPSAEPDTNQTVTGLMALAPTLLTVCAFMVLYRTMPRTRLGWRDVWLGGLVAGLVWEAGKRIFTWYVSNIADYGAMYGSVEAIIAFLLWCYLSGQIILLGAEFTAEYSRWLRAGRPMETRALSEWMPGWSRRVAGAAWPPAWSSGSGASRFSPGT